MQPARPSPRFRVTAARYRRLPPAEGAVVAEAVEEAAAVLGEAEEFRTFRLCGRGNRSCFLRRRAFIAFPGLLAAEEAVAAAHQLLESSR